MAGKGSRTCRLSYIVVVVTCLAQLTFVRATADTNEVAALPLHSCRNLGTVLCGGKLDEVSCSGDLYETSCGDAMPTGHEYRQDHIRTFVNVVQQPTEKVF